MVPNVDITILDGTLGVLPPSTGNVQGIVGISSLGLPNQVYSFAGSQAQSLLTSTLGTGPLVEDAAQVLAQAGGPILCVPAQMDTPGYVSATSPAPGNTGSAVLTVSLTESGPYATPLDQYALVVTVKAAAANLAANAATFQYSLDGGTTQSAVLAMPTSGIYAIPNTGLTLTWANGTFVLGDSWVADTVAPGYSTSSMLAALAALAAAGGFSWFHVVGAPAPAWPDGEAHATSGAAYTPTTTGTTPPAVTVFGTPVEFGLYELLVVATGVRLGSAQFSGITAAGTSPPTVTVDASSKWGGIAGAVTMDVTQSGTAAGLPQYGSVAFSGSGTSRLTVDAGALAQSAADISPGLVVTITAVGGSTAYAVTYSVTYNGITVTGLVGPTASGGVTFKSESQPTLGINGVWLDFPASGSGNYVALDTYTVTWSAPALVTWTAPDGTTASNVAIPANGQVVFGSTGIQFDCAHAHANAYTNDNTYSSTVTAAAIAVLTVEGVPTLPQGATVPTAAAVLAPISTYPVLFFIDPTNRVIPGSGVTMITPAGTYTAGATPATYTWDTSTWPLASSVAIVAQLDEVLSSWETNHYYAFGIMDLPAAPDAAIEAAFTDVVSTSLRVMVGAGRETVTSPITGDALNRSASHSISARLSADMPGVSASRVKDGPLLGVTAIDHNEASTPGFDNLGLASLRTVGGKAGFFVNQPRILVALTSNFSLAQYRRVMDIACNATYAFMSEELNDDVPVNPTTGFIDETFAAALESQATQFVTQSLNGNPPSTGYVTNSGTNVSNVTVTVSRTDDILATGTIHATVSIVPLAYLGQIDVVIAFVNPAISAG